MFETKSKYEYFGEGFLLGIAFGLFFLGVAFLVYNQGWENALSETKKNAPYPCEDVAVSFKRVLEDGQVTLERKVTVKEVLETLPELGVGCY